MKMNPIAISEKIISTKGQGRYRDYRIPGIAISQRQSIFLTYEARAQDKGDWGDIDIVVLRGNQGGTFETVLTVGESHLPPTGQMRTFNNPVLIPDGERLHLIYHQNYQKAFITTTEDEGATWSKKREITSTYRAFPYQWNVCATGPGHGIQMNTGRLVAPIWLANGAYDEVSQTTKHWPSVAGSIYSDDHGLTWHPGALSPCITSGNETSIAQLNDGRLLYNFRNMNEDRRRVLGLSADGGETFEGLWSSPTLEDPMCFSGMVAVKGGVLLVNCPSTTHRENLTIKYPRDAGQTWQKLLQVDTLGGYADIGATDHRVWVFYERYAYDTRIVEELVLKEYHLSFDT